MELKVLGSSSSGNCYLLSSKTQTLILECGIPYKSILKGLDYDLESIAGCLVTHEHKDHSKAIQDLIKHGINVYTSKGTAEACGVSGYRVKKIESEHAYSLGEFFITPFEVEHDAAEPLGFYIYHPEMGNLLFLTDSYYCQYNFKGLDHIMIECNYSKEILQQNIEDGLNPAMARRLLKSHFSLDNVKSFLKVTDLSQVKDITLIHLSDGNSNAVKFREEVERLTGKPVYIAENGLELEL